MQKVEVKKHVITIVLVAIFAIFSIIALAPFYFMIISSLKPGTEMMRNGINSKIQLDIMSFKNYFTLFTDRDGLYLYWFKSSLSITFLFTIVSLFFTSMVGYGLGMYKFKGRNLVFTTVLIVMMIPVQILLLPLFKLLIGLKLINTIWGVVLPFAVAPSAVFFFRQYVVSLPKDYLDAGRIDGCTEYGIYLRIMVPLMLPAFGAMTILMSLNSWNDLLWPLIVLRNNESFTLPVGLASLITPYGNNYDMLMPGCVMSVVPIVIIFLFNQKSFVSGLTVGGVKG